MEWLNQFVYRPWGTPIPASAVCNSSLDCGRDFLRRARAFMPVQSYLNGPSLHGMGRYITLVELQRRNANASGFAGLGQASTGQTIALSAPQITGGVLTAVASTGGIWGMTAAVAVPVIGAVVAGVTMGLMAIFRRKGPKQRVATTEIVNKVEPLLKQNVDGYLSGPHTRSSQAQALANFDAGWQYVLEYCGTSEMGNPGKACISDRQAGACVWKDEQGECWNWFVGYRDPIANDAGVVSDPVLDEAGNLIDSITGKPVSGGLLGGSSGLLLAGALAIGALMMGGGKK